MATTKHLDPTNVDISIPAMTDQPNASVFSNCVDKEADAINSLNSKVENIGAQSVLLNESTSISASYASTGKTFTLTKTSIVSIAQGYSNALPTAIGAKSTDTSAGTSVIYAENSGQEESVAGLTGYGVLQAGTYYVWAKAKAAASNTINVTVYPIRA